MKWVRRNCKRKCECGFGIVKGGGGHIIVVATGCD